VKFPNIDLNRQLLYVAVIVALLIAGTLKHQLSIKATGVEFRPGEALAQQK
jgi:hypothetical protein